MERSSFPEHGNGRDPLSGSRVIGQCDTTSTVIRDLCLSLFPVSIPRLPNPKWYPSSTQLERHLPPDLRTDSPPDGGSRLVFVSRLSLSATVDDLREPGPREGEIVHRLELRDTRPRHPYPVVSYDPNRYPSTQSTTTVVYNSVRFRNTGPQDLRSKMDGFNVILPDLM